MLLILLLIVILSLILLVILQNYTKNVRYNHPPGPKGLPLIGNLHQLDLSTAPHLLFSKLGKIYGPIFSLRLGCRSAVVIQSASLAKEVLKTQDHNFCNRPTMVALQRLSYYGKDLAFVNYDDYYRDMRKIYVVHLFSSKKVQSWYPIRREEVSRMIQKVSSLASAFEIADMKELLMDLTSSIISRVAFGKNYKTDEKIERKRFHTLLNEAEEMFTGLFLADYFPVVGGWVDNLTGMKSKLERVSKDFDAFYDEIIKDHLQPERIKDDDHEDIVDILLQLRRERCYSFELTLDHIKAVLMNMITAGTDTSAIMIIWTMTELIKNAHVMRKVQDELRTNLIEGKTFIDEDDLSKLTYLKAVVKETFRLHPAAPLLIVRETIQNCKLQGYDILPKTMVHVNIWEISRDSEIWVNPEVFIPERFLESLIDFKGQNFELISFGAGRRMCPGMLMGIANMELALANLLYSFDWEPPIGMKTEDIDTEVIPGIAMHKKNPLCLVAKRFSI